MVEAAWLIPAFPLAGFLTLMVFGRRLGEPLAGWLATAAMFASFAATCVVYAGLLAEDEAHRFSIQTLFTWITAGSFTVDVGLLVDPLSITLCLFVTGVGALIHLYAIGYMHGDPDYSKFFLYLNLFAASMLVLVLGDNLLLTFLGWEGVGVCSYLLISFWFTDEANASAGKKAFVTNRVGDFGFMVAMFLVFHEIGSIRYVDVLTSEFSSTAATAIVLLFLLAAAGKSAQIPLYVWLPDAMAGPTPVSALIHAATMVTSGVYLLTRLNPVLAQADDWVLSLIAWLGVITAFVAALAAVLQNDIKKVLAYSTVSQLGYLFLAVGVGGYVAAIFHMVTHAFFKALLFLGSGSVIHGLHGEQDMRRMGGLAKFMPVTAATFIVGWLAIAGVPPFAGFWSKDEILLFAWNESPLLWLVGLVTAVLTAFYMARLVILTFFGRLRFRDPTSDEIDLAFAHRSGDAAAAAASAEQGLDEAKAAVGKAGEDLFKREEAYLSANASLTDATAAVDASSPDAEGHDKLVKALDKATKAVPKAETALEKARASVVAANEQVAAAEQSLEQSRATVNDVNLQKLSAPSVPEHVSARTPAPDVSEIADDMPPSYRDRGEATIHESPWTMTVPLVALAGLAIFGGALNLPFTKELHFLEHWLEPSLFGNEAHPTAGAELKWLLAVLAAIGGFVAIAAAFAVYVSERARPADVERSELGLAMRWDAFLAAFMGGPGRALFQASADFDRTVIDGSVDGVATSVQTAGRGLKVTQPGLVRQYALGVLLGVIALGLWFLARLWA